MRIRLKRGYEPAGEREPKLVKMSGEDLYLFADTAISQAGGALAATRGAHLGDIDEALQNLDVARRVTLELRYRAEIAGQTGQ